MQDSENKIELLVDKIYITRKYLSLNTPRPSKVAGVVIHGCIYWLKCTFNSIDELTRAMSGLNVSIESSKNKKRMTVNKWGVVDKHNKGVIDKNFTTIQKEPSAVFCMDSSYIKRAVRTQEGSLFWSVDELRAHFPNATYNRPF